MTRVDVYRKIAVEALAQIQNRTPAVFVLTSSREEADCLNAAKELAAAFSAVAGDAGVETLPASDGLTAKGAGAKISGCKDARSVTVLPLPCLRRDTGAMLLAAAAENVLLLERQGVSRTDEIEETLAVIRNLSARAVGFVLEYGRRG